MTARSDPRNRAYALGSILLGAAIIIALLLLSELDWYVDWLIGWSVALFALYGVDKAQAKLDGWRVPEVWLHGLALVGGFIGGWLGMFIFRHKTRHPAFKVVLAVATALGVVLFYLFVLRQ